MDEAVDVIEQRTGYRFRNASLLQEALTHPSAVKEGRSVGPDNQRLEYLGDAVVQLAVSQLLMERFPLAGEGDLSFMRADLVRKENLAEVAFEAGILDLILVGPSLETAFNVARRKVAADALEALAGAIFLDSGWMEARELVGRLFPELPEPGDQLKGSKSALQEIIQGRFSGEIPEYRVSENRGQTGEERFRAQVYHRERRLGEGTGRSKKRAEEAAAADALEKIRENA